VNEHAETRLLEARHLTRRAAGARGAAATPERQCRSTGASDSQSAPATQPLLDDVSLQLTAGDRRVVTGPTGSGKTLLLRALALLDAVDEGEVLWHGKPVADADVPRFRREVIYLQQQPALIEGTVEDNLRLPFRFKSNREVTFSRERCVAILSQWGLDESFLRKQTANLSGGETQMTALLRALLLEPAVLLLDEPTAALDAHSTENFERVVNVWFHNTHKPRAFLWVTHNAEQAERVGNGHLSMQAGQLNQP